MFVSPGASGGFAMFVFSILETAVSPKLADMRRLRDSCWISGPDKYLGSEPSADLWTNDRILELETGSQ